MIHEARVAGLEARLAELSEIVGGYDRLRQQDQLAIQKLKDRLAALQDTEYGEAVALSNRPEEIISKIKTLYSHLLDLDNKKKDSAYIKGYNYINVTMIKIGIKCEKIKIRRKIE